MKTAMKRLLSFMLVAMMLVSVVPFQASADGDDQAVVLNGSDENTTETQPAPTETQPAPTETQPAPTETQPAPTETQPAPTETQPAPTETQPAPTETQPAPTETQPAPTETQPAPTETQPAPTETQPENNEFTVTFKFCDEDNCGVCKEEGTCVTVTRTTVNHKLKTGDVPGVPDRYGYSFDYWKNVSNGTKGLQDTYTSDVTYVAVYKKDADSNLHKLKVFGVTYNHGKTNILSEPLATIYVQDEADLLTALQAKATAIQGELNARGYTQANKYTWDGVTFYDDSDMDSDDKVATGTEVTGNGNYYIKVSYTGNNKVQLYIHTSKTLTIKDTVTLTTYAPGETISKSQISTAVKNDGWSYGTIRTYTQDSWEKIVDRDSSSAADETKSFKVVEGETEIHVYLTGASSSSSNKSDNPKTGDTILMAVTVMGLSASALAAVYFISKKKQSV